MFVAASTGCFPHLSLDATLDRLGHLEFTNVEIVIDERSDQLKPSEVAADLEYAVQRCRQTHRLTPVAYNLNIETASEAEYYEQFYACCRLAKATKVVSLTVPSSELGTPFNAEVERLRELVRIGSAEGVLVSMKTECGKITEDPSTIQVLCQNVKGLGITLDPSHFICGPHPGVDLTSLIPYVYHTQLRDTSKEKLQVRVGQGEVEYGRLVTQLEGVNYRRALTVDITADPEEDPESHAGEMRKLRLLLESLL